MKRKASLLIVDDHAIWRNDVGALLAKADFAVDAAETIAQAMEKIAASVYHLLILDISITGVAESDEQGMEFLRTVREQGLSRDILPIIMLSGYGTTERMQTAFSKYDVSYFIQKQTFNHVKFVEDVWDALRTKLRINLDLEIRWPQASPAADSSTQTTPDVTAETQAEREDVLCRLFYNARSLIMSPLTGGRSGASVYSVHPFYANGGARPVVVKLGDAHAVAAEHAHFMSYVQPFVGGRRSTSVQAVGRSLHLGGIVYSLLDATDDHMRNFGQFYQEAPLRRVTEVVEGLFRDTCGMWYKNPGKLEPINLTQEYQSALRFTRERLEHAMSNGLRVTQSHDSVSFEMLPTTRPLRNPLAAVDRDIWMPTYRCITHGDLNQHNIMVDASGSAWLIDFQRTGESHILRDFVHLDAVVRFQLLETDEATLEERLHMERVLGEVDGLDPDKQLAAGTSIGNAAVFKAFAISLFLRNLARRLTPGDTTHHQQQRIYAIASLYAALNAVKFAWLPLIQREHALLCACLLAEQVG